MLTKNKNILLKNKYKKGFTLVELIIVITILAILATIAFVSFQGYTKNTRDANRLGTMNSMSKGLEISLIKNSVLPHPETPVVIYDNSETIGYQGYFGDEIARITGFDKTPKDPLDDKKYTYLTSKDYKKFQLLSLMETSDYLTLSNDLLPKTFADGTNYSKRVPKTFGYDLGVLLGNGNNDKNKPIQEDLSASFTGINIDTSTSYKAVVSNSKSVSGSGITILKNTIKNSYDNSLIGYWDMETSYMSGSTPYIKDLSGNGVDCKSNISLNNSTGGLNGKSLRNTNGAQLSAIACMPNIGVGKSFTLFLTYKTNIIDNSYVLNIKTNIPASPSGGIFSIFGTNGGNNSSSVFIYNNTLYNGIYNIPNSLVSNNVINGTNHYDWNIVTISYDGSNYNLYNNGTKVLAKKIDNLGFNNLFISRGWYYYNTVEGSNIKGDINIDDTKLYNKALDDNEIAKIYNQMK